MDAQSERPTSFQCDGFRLFGSLHVPAREALSTGVVFVNAGPTDRAGPHRFYLEWARRMARLGYPTLRFDPRGTGESEGEWPEALAGAPLQAIYQLILDGAWQRDTRNAIDFLLAETGVRRVVLVGLCGGAITALVGAAGDERVSGFFLMGMPTTNSSATGRISDLPEKMLRDESGRYLKKLLNLKAWWRLVTLQTDYRTLAGVVYSRLRVRLRPGRPERADKRNPLLVTRFARAVRAKQPIRFLFSENDYLWQEFQEQFMGRPEFESAAGVSLSVIAGANHVMTETEWHEQAFADFRAWVASAHEGGSSDTVLPGNAVS